MSEALSASERREFAIVAAVAVATIAALAPGSHHPYRLIGIFAALILAPLLLKFAWRVLPFVLIAGAGIWLIAALIKIAAWPFS